MNLRILAGELSAVPHGAKSRLVSKYAEQFGVSKHTIYRELRKIAGASKKIVREKAVDQGLIDSIAMLKEKGINGIEGRELSTEICIDILKMQSTPGADDLIVSTVNRRLAESGYRQREPIVRVEAKYANEQHQLDFSRSKYFQVYKFENGDYILKATTKSLSYKENEYKLRTWLVGITDAYSRASLTKAYAATGESVLIGIDFLNFVYTRDEDEHPLRFIPDVLKTDNGAFIKNKSVSSMLEKLEIASELVVPYKKHGIQKQEAKWKTLWRRFELKEFVKFGEGYTISLSGYNELLHEFNTSQLEQRHPVKSSKCGHVYRASLTANPPRQLTSDLREIIARPWVRTIDDTCCVSIDNQKYLCSNWRYIGKRVRVWMNLAGEAVAELMDEFSKPFVLTATDGYVMTGDYSGRHPQLYRDAMQEKLKSEDPVMLERHSDGAKQAAESNVQYIKPRVTEVEVETVFTNSIDDENYSFPSTYKAKVYIAEQLGRQATYSRYAQVFDPLIDTTLKRSDIDKVIQEIKLKRVAQ